MRTAGCVFAEEEAALLLSAASTSEELRRLVEHRVRGVPLEHVLGWAEFAGLRIAVTPGVFVPRRRSELMIIEALRLARRGALVVDVCCGSGALGSALAQRLPNIDLYAADIDPRAVSCARRNLPAERVFQGDLCRALPTRLRGKIDMLLVNAPYVPTDAVALMPREARLYEPRQALDGGPDGLDLQRRVAVEASSWLRPDGALIMETSGDQAPVTAHILVEQGFSVRIVRDDEFEATVAVAARQTEGSA